jgi:DNA polymerase-3 subunit gamma/tau
VARAKSTVEPGSKIEPAAPSASAYTVIARRYRPQRFEDVVGQDHVVQSLRNAITMNRLGQAYLFAGTRGVGKTSIARIFAKCLNCVKGPTVDPDLTCDICQAIAVGQDVDVIEIDGASNNGVEQVRELRQNAGLRPSRARFKIYYIDEVHMLSTGAFNALLKTLEEPPPHVKFFFATTEPNKIPETVRSRCQRYDFSGITPEQAVATLGEICAMEGVKAEPEALRAIARRGGGSMRDAQSLLEQLLSADDQTLTLELVHKRLGTPSDERILDLIDALADHDSAAVLKHVEEAANSGVQPPDVLGGLLEFLRDVMVLAAGSENILIAASPRQAPRLRQVADRWPLDSILASLQILAETRGKLRGGTHGRFLVELALVRVARLENFGELGMLIGRLSALESGRELPPLTVATQVAPQKKRVDPPEPVRPAATSHSASQPPARSPRPGLKSAPPAAVEPDSPPPLTLDLVNGIWPALLKMVGSKLAFLLAPNQGLLAVLGPSTLALKLPAGYTGLASKADTPEGRAKIEQGLQQLLKRPIAFHFERAADSENLALPPAREGARIDEFERDPLVLKVVELFEARLDPKQTVYEDESEPNTPS